MKDLSNFDWIQNPLKYNLEDSNMKDKIITEEKIYIILTFFLFHDILFLSIK